jgi:GT2 family glycosyltransferase
MTSPTRADQRFRVAAVVVTMEKEHEAAACLTSLIEGSYPLVRIVVVDNGSRDGSVARLRRRFADRSIVEFVCNPENVGYASAANVGIRRTLHDVEAVLLVNDDAELAVDAVDRMVNELTTSGAVGFAAPLIAYKQSPHLVWSGRPRYSWLKGGLIDPQRNQPLPLDRSIPRQANIATGCVLLARAIALREVGLFDEELFVYGEDMDLLLRAQRAGWGIVHVPQAQAWHSAHYGHLRVCSVVAAHHLGRSHVVVIRKHAPWPIRPFALAIHWLAHGPVVGWRMTRAAHSFRPLVAWVRGSVAGHRLPIPRRTFGGIGRRR